MGPSDNKLYLVDMVKSWIPRRTEPPNVSRDFWMPDQSCRVCYECDSQFTIFNRKHHCRLCGRVFCAKCTMNSVPAHSDDVSTVGEDSERIRVCNYCFKQWKQGVATDDGSHVQTPRISPSPSLTSLVSSSSSTCLSSNSTVGSFSFSTAPYQNISYNAGQSSFKSARTTPVTEPEHITSESKENFSEFASHSSSNQCHYWLNRSDEDDDYGAYHFDNDISHYSHVSDYYDAHSVPEVHNVYAAHEMPPDSDNTHTKSLSYSTSPPQRHVENGLDEFQELEGDGDEHDQGCESSAYDKESEIVEPVDFENNELLWLPPKPEDEEDEREVGLFDDDDDDDEGTTGEWGYLCNSSSFGSGEYRIKAKSSDEHRNAMKNVVEGHFKALVSQLLQVENLPVGDENDKEGWLEIITSLSWEAASLLKPDTSKSAGMDPGGYVKVKCLACGHRRESMVVKGVLCKKNVAHRRMTSRIEKPRFLILGGALEYQRVSNTLSSFDTLLQQEKDHLKMAVAKIDAHHPSVLLVEKSVSRYAQEYLLAKDISLVLNIKRPLLERIARCTGAQIVPSIDHLTSQKLGYCETFHVEKFFEEYGSAGLGGKKLTKNLMFFEGCPRPLGCTILLKGADGDELKKVKHVVQYGIFAAYHLAMETSFLADEGALLPELPLTSPITVALPNKASNIDRSISTIPVFSIPSSSGELPGEGFETYRTSSLVTESRITSDMTSKLELPCSGKKIKPGQDLSSPKSDDFLAGISVEEIDEKALMDSLQCKRDVTREGLEDYFASAPCDYSEHFGQVVHSDSGNTTALTTDNNRNQGSLFSIQGISGHNECSGSSKEEFSPSPSDQQSILVFLSTRCVWSGTVCEASHLVRIKYYGSSDKPLGRFLRDQLFEQSYRCDSCDKPSEAHVHCYTHRHGSLTISVKKLPETLLPGEREGKIWMWHRCLKCPRINGFPPATQRVVMSNAAWGLSFGKFLELSFSNHAAASRVASCGHSLHRDCLRFYGFGKMVACFRYASIDLHSVYLPPAKLEFSYNKQEWMQIEANEVQNMAETLFRQVYCAINQIATKISDVGVQGSIKKDEFMYPLLELKGTLRKEKEEFEELLQKAFYREVKAGQYAVDILELYKLRRLIMLHSYVWDQRLIHAANMIKSLLGDFRSPLPTSMDNQINSSDGLTELNAPDRSGNGYNHCASFHLEEQEEGSPNMGEGSQPGEVHQGQHTNGESSNEKIEHSLASSPNVGNMQDSLESGKTVRRALSKEEHHVNLSDSLDAAWTGESHPLHIPIKEKGYSLPENVILPSSGPQFRSKSSSENSTIDKGVSADVTCTSSSPIRPDIKWTEIAFSNFYSSFNKILPRITPKLPEYIPVYITLMRDLDRQTGARLLFPSGVNDTVVPVYDDEPTSIVAHALVSMEYHTQMSESDKDSSGSLPLIDSTKLFSFNSCDEAITDAYRSLTDESVVSASGPRNSQVMDPLTYTKDLHIRVSFTDETSLGKVKYNVTCYYAKRFEALRRICCPSELDFIQSLSRCKKWGAQGGKSNVFFAKTLDDRFIIKQVTKTELESFIKFAPAYFKYLSESISTGSPTCLAKILGIYQVSSKHLKGGKETKMDILVMENLLFGRNVKRLYDLKGSSRSRYNSDTSGKNKVLLDQNLIESMPTSPIFVGHKPKRLLGRAVWNDSGFLASVHVMDYSLLVGVDEQKHELVLGIIDFMRQYTWDKHLETWVKTSGILGGPKNASPTVISPQQYKKRFRKAMGAYFLMVPEWSPPVSQPSESLSDFCDEKS